MPNTVDEVRLEAWLPDGRRFRPAAGEAGIASCAGPDPWGECPALAAGRAPRLSIGRLGGAKAEWADLDVPVHRTLAGLPSRAAQPVSRVNLLITHGTTAGGAGDGDRARGYGVALRAVIKCGFTTAKLFARRRLHLRAEHLRLRLRFADGTSAHVDRETVADRGPTTDPCVLMVEFRASLGPSICEHEISSRRRSDQSLR